MPQRKITPTGEEKNGKPVRFTPEDIVRAIEGVQAAGLTVYGVEITLTGAINISTRPPPSVSKRPATPRQASLTNLVDEITPKQD